MLDIQKQQHLTPTDHAQQVVSAVSHDFRGPARQIKSFLQLLEAQLGNTIDSDAKEYLDLISAAADSLQEKLDALSRLSKAAKADFKPSDNQLKDLAEAALTQLDRGEEQLEISGSTTLRGDTDLLVTLFAELFDNSFKFCSAPVEITVSAEPYGDANCLVTISDTGPGFAAPNHNGAFDLFKKYHVGEFPGTGTGLAVVRRILERHESSATIESDPETGTTIRFTLP